MKKKDEVVKDDIGIFIPIISLLLAFSSIINIFILIMMYVFRNDINETISYTNVELILILILSMLTIVSLMLICLRKKFAVYLYYVVGIIKLITQIMHTGIHDFGDVFSYLFSILIPIIYFILLYKRNYIYHLKDDFNKILKR